MKTLFIKKIVPLLLLSSIYTYGQGVLKGIVRDSLTGCPLKGTEIFLTGTNFSTVADIDGEFYISGIPFGEYILQTFYLGYKEKKILITIKSKETFPLNVELVPDIKVKDGTILTGQAGSQTEEINMQLSSTTIKNVISEEKLQDMPDENISLELSRLPGVSIIHNSLSPPYIYNMGSGGKVINDVSLGILFPPQDNFPIVDDPAVMVLIRGLDSKFADINIDGVRIPSNSANNKGTDLNIFSGRDFKNIELNKTITSDKDADATAGSINIITGKAPGKRIIKAELSGNYNKLDNSANQFNFNGNYGERFFGNLLGIQVNTNADKKILSSEYLSKNVRSLFTNYFSYTNAVRKKYGASILLDFDTPDGGFIRFNNFFNKTSSKYSYYEADSSFSESDHIFNDRQTEQRIFLSSIGGSNYLFGFYVNWNAAFSESEINHPFNYSLAFLKRNISLSANQPSFLDYTIDNPSKNYFKEKSVSINIFKRYNLINKITGEFNFGGKYSTNSRYYDEHLYAENGSLAGNNQFIKLTDGSLVKKDFSGTRFDGLLGKPIQNIFISNFQDNPSDARTILDKYKIPLISMDALRLWRQLNYSPYYENQGPDINSYNFSGSVFAGYIMHYLNFEKWVKFITGIRIESEKNSYSGYYFPDILTSPDSLYNGIPLQTNTYNYNKVTVLPNFQMILRPADFLNLRMAVYKTLIRPDINARMPKIFSAHIDGIYYNNADAGNYLSMGNPDLKNADVWNYEFQTQFYGNHLGLFSINAFYKNITGMVHATNGITLSSAGTIDSLGINLKSLPISYPFKINSFYNLYTYYQTSEPTHIWGFEIEHQTNFRYLPGLLKNIILNYNLTFLRSETWTFNVLPISAATTEDIVSYSRHKLNNMPEFFANVVLGYDINKFSFRISYFYQDGYPVPIDSYYLQEMENKFSRLDIAVKQNILNNIYVFLNLNNITNSKEEALVKGIVETWTTAEAYRYGFNLDFGVGIDL